MQDKKDLISLDQSNSSKSTTEGVTLTTAAVKEWWKKKRRNNQDLLFAAEYGNLDEVQRLLDKEGPL